MDESGSEFKSPEETEAAAEFNKKTGGNLEKPELKSDDDPLNSEGEQRLSDGELATSQQREDLDLAERAFAHIYSKEDIATETKNLEADGASPEQILAFDRTCRGMPRLQDVGWINKIIDENRFPNGDRNPGAEMMRISQYIESHQNGWDSLDKHIL